MSAICLTVDGKYRLGFFSTSLGKWLPCRDMSGDATLDVIAYGDLKDPLSLKEYFEERC